MLPPHDELSQLILNTAYAELEHNEDLLDQLFWDFDDKSNKIGDTEYTFKGIVRHYVTELIKQYQQRIIEAHQSIVIPDIGSSWIHMKSGEVYEIFDITNDNSEKLLKFPYMVQYRRNKDSSDWSRPLVFWYQDFQIVG